MSSYCSFVKSLKPQSTKIHLLTLSALMDINMFTTLKSPINMAKQALLNMDFGDTKALEGVLPIMEGECCIF